MPGIAAIIAFVMSNPALVAAGTEAVKEMVAFVTNAINLHKAGVLTDEQLAAVWAAVGVDVDNADAAWAAAKAAHNAALLPAA